MTTPTVTDPKSEDVPLRPGPVRRLLRYVLPYSWLLFASVTLMAMVGLLDAGRVLLIGPIFDRVLNPGSQGRTIQLFRLPGTGRFLNLQELVPSHFQNPWTVVAFALVAATVLKGIFDYAGTYLVNYAGFGMITDLRDDLYNAILRSSAAFFAKHTTGTLLSTLVKDIERVQYAMSGVLAEFLQQFFTLIFTAAVVILLGGKLAWVLVRFRAAARRLFRANLRLVAAFAISSPLMDILGSVAIALLLLMGRNQINNHVFTAGTFLAFIVAVFKLYDPVRKFALFNNNFQQAVGASSEIFRFMDMEDEVREKPAAKRMGKFARAIRFEDVSFSYANLEDSPFVLHDINLEVKAGEVLAVVGSSGAGKSTLGHLIPRFFDVSGGPLLVYDHDARDATLDSLRSQIGIVTQETVLFNDTVRNNIAYGQPHVSQKKVEEAARMARAHEFLTGLPEGYG